MRRAANQWVLSGISHTLVVLGLLCSFFCVHAQDYRQLEEELLRETNDSLRVVKTMTLTRAIHRQNHQEKQEYELAQHAVDLALLLNDTLLYARALDNIGLLYR